MSLTPYHRDDLVTLYHGDCIEVMRALPDSSVDAVVTDPPYGLEFMGKEWDSFAPQDRVNAARWNGRRESREGWQEDAAARSGKGGGGPSYGAKRHTFKRCTICGKRSFSGSPCVCPEPDWIVESPEGAPTQMLAFQSWCTEWATEALRVLKPGGHLLAFGGTRTWHRLACAIEDAGFEVRDSIAWMYGSGFPKSLDVSKAIDKAAGATREVVGVDPRYVGMSDKAKRALGSVVHDGTGGTGFSGDPSLITAPATPEAKTWQGWGTALKPAFEPIVVARKPLIGTVAANVLAHGTGALNVDWCRVGFASDADEQSARALGELRAKGRRLGVLGEPGQGDSLAASVTGDSRTGTEPVVTNPAGRWPANVILDESQARALDAMSGVLKAGEHPASAGITSQPGEASGTMNGGWSGMDRPTRTVLDTGGASRFFYTAKADSSERPRVKREGEAGTTYQTSAAERCVKCGKQRVNVPGSFCVCEEPEFAAAPTNEGYLAHPTVKPLTLMRYLVRLVTPPGGVVLEPFAGSGTTLEACIVEGFSCIGIEREADYIPLIMQRITKPIEVTLL